MINQDHREPCQTLQEAVRLLTEVTTNEHRTREWVRNACNDLKVTNSNVVHLEKTVIEKLSSFNNTLATRTSVIGGGIGGTVIVIIELIRYFVKG